MSSRGKNCLLVLGAVMVWVPAIAAGMRVLIRYSSTPGERASPPGDWPLGTAIQAARDRATLVVFAHPQCPCTQATIGELAKIMAHSGNKVAAYVFFYAPELQTTGWVKAGLWKSVESIPGVHAIEDPAGIEARHFHAATSGQTLLYAAGGHLVFSGGITASRGHFGENDGRDAILSLLLTGSAPLNTTPVFGCSLLGETRP